MSAAAELLVRCHQCGIELTIGATGKIVWESDSEPPADLLGALRMHKPDILRVLSNPRAPVTSFAGWACVRTRGWLRIISHRPKMIAREDLAEYVTAYGDAVLDSILLPEGQAPYAPRIRPSAAKRSGGPYLRFRSRKLIDWRQ